MWAGFVFLLQRPDQAITEYKSGTAGVSALNMPKLAFNRETGEVVALIGGEWQIPRVASDGKGSQTVRWEPFNNNGARAPASVMDADAQTALAEVHRRGLLPPHTATAFQAKL